VPELHPDEDFSKMPPHYAMSQLSADQIDHSVYAEPEGHGVHGLQSHLHDKKKLAKDIAVYYGMTSMMDKYIGKILDKLEELGLADNTIVVFTTDHGHFHGHHGLIAKCIFNYEDMQRIPFIVAGPNVPVEQKNDALQSLVDLAPTFLSATGNAIPRSMTGVDQKEVWFGEQDAARDHVIIENRHQPTKFNTRTYVDKRYKISVYYNQEYGELFDLQEDSGELKNLWDCPEHQELKRDLLLKYIHAELGKEPVPMPRVWGA
jgi:uncharacterized sulfatase